MINYDEVIADALNAIREQSFREGFEAGSKAARQVVVDEAMALLEGMSGKPEAEATPATASPTTVVDDDIAIEELRLTLRPYNALKRAGIHTVSQLTALTESELYETTSGIGTASMRQIVDELLLLGLKLKEEPQTPDTPDSAWKNEKLYDLLIGGSTRIYTVLDSNRIWTLGQLVRLTEADLLGIERCGPTTVEIIKRYLKERGLKLAS